MTLTFGPFTAVATKALFNALRFHGLRRQTPRDPSVGLSYRVVSDSGAAPFFGLENRLAP